MEPKAEFKKGDILIDKTKKIEVVFKSYTTDARRFRTEDDFIFLIADFTKKQTNH